MAYRYTAYRSPLGMIYLLASKRGLLAVSIGEKWEIFRRRYAQLAPGDWDKVEPEEDQHLSQAVPALERYFKKGVPLPKNILLDPQGTPFQRKVWWELRRIPHGQTVSYSEVAQRIGLPKAPRAIGRACGSNPLPLFIPCHRVIAGDGSLCGFGGGLDLKKRLLALEGHS